MSTLREVKVLTAPATEPITLAEAKDWMKIKTGFTDDDTLIQDTLIPAARRSAEKHMSRSLITQTIQLYYTKFSGRIYLPYGPYQSISTVTRILLNVDTVLTENTDFYVQGLDDKFLIMANPHTQLRAGQSPNDNFLSAELKVQAVTGYGAASAVPDEVKVAIRMIVAESYNQRTDTTEKGRALIPKTAKTKLAPYVYVSV